jgi:hypothetical protein
MVVERKPYLTIGILLLCLCAVCTPPPPLGSAPRMTEILPKGEISSPFSANGKAIIATDRERYQGSIDVSCDSNGVFNALWYGPLGIVVASLAADTVSGVVTVDNGTFAFRRDQTMDTLPFAWGGGLRFGDQIDIISGRIPGPVGSVACGPYDSLWIKKKAINMRWKTDNMTILAVVGRKTGMIEKIVATIKGKKPWTLTMDRFRNGSAYKIEVKEDDRNYFSIHYERVRNR